MASSPALLNPSLDLSRIQKPWVLPRIQKHWIAVLCCLAFVCFTSTTLMSGYHTQFVVDGVWKALFGNWHNDWRGMANGDGRKIGHFFGYGMVGLIFRNAWERTLSARAVRLGRTLVNSRLMILAALMSVFSIFLVALADELHQCFLPQRVGSFGDVLRDTFGTVFLNLVLLAWRAYKRPAAASLWEPVLAPDNAAC